MFRESTTWIAFSRSPSCCSPWTDIGRPRDFPFAIFVITASIICIPMHTHRLVACLRVSNLGGSAATTCVSTQISPRGTQGRVGHFWLHRVYLPHHIFLPNPLRTSFRPRFPLRSERAIALSLSILPITSSCWLRWKRCYAHVYYGGT